MIKFLPRQHIKENIQIKNGQKNKNTTAELNKIYIRHMCNMQMRLKIQIIYIKCYH